MTTPQICILGLSAITALVCAYVLWEAVRTRRATKARLAKHQRTVAKTFN